MSKKMLKRSLALGALMAFVITGSAMAAETTVDGRVETFEPMIGLDSLVINGAPNGQAIYIADDSEEIKTLTIKANSIELKAAAEGSSVLYIADPAKNKKIDIDFSTTMTILSDNNAISNHGEGCIIDIDGGNGSVFTADVPGNAIWVYGEAVNSETSIKADTVNIKSSKDATTICVYGKDSKVDIEAKELTLIRDAKDKCVVFLGEDTIYNSGDAEGAIVSIKATEKATISGDLRTDVAHSRINLDIAGSVSTFTGKTLLNNDDAEINIKLNEGATWNMTGDSTVTTLSGTSGVINKADVAPQDVTLRIEDYRENNKHDGEGIYSGVALTNESLKVTDVKLVVDTYETSIYNSNVKIESNSDVSINSQHDDGICVYGNVEINGKNVTITANDNGIKSADGDIDDNNENAVDRIDVGNVTIKAIDDVNIQSTNEGYAITNVSVTGGKVSVEGKNVNLSADKRSAIRVGHVADGVTFNGTVDVKGENVTVEGFAGYGDRTDDIGSYKPSVVYAEGKGTLNLSATNNITITDTATEDGNSIGAYDGGVVTVIADKVKLDSKIFANGEGSKISFTNVGDDNNLELTATGEKIHGINAESGATVELAKAKLIITAEGEGDTRACAIDVSRNGLVESNKRVTAVVKGGAWVAGVEATYEGSVTLKKATLNVTDNGSGEAYGINVARQGTAIVNNELIATITGGEWASGVEAYNGSNINVGDGTSNVNLTVTASSQTISDPNEAEWGVRAHGIFAAGQSNAAYDDHKVAFGKSAIDVNAANLTVNATANYGQAYGIYAQDEGNVKANGAVNITATGYSAYGVEAVNGSTVEIGASDKDVTFAITSNGVDSNLEDKEYPEAQAITAEGGSKVTVNAKKLDITTSVTSGVTGSLQARDNGSEITVKATDVDVTGDIFADEGANVVINTTNFAAKGNIGSEGVIDIITGDVVYDAGTQFYTKDNGAINLAGGNASGVLNIYEDSTVNLTGATFTATDLSKAIAGDGKLVVKDNGVLKTTADQVFTVADKDTVVTDKAAFTENAIKDNVKEKVTFESGALSLSDDYSYEYLTSITNVMKEHKYNGTDNSQTKLVMTGTLVNPDSVDTGKIEGNLDVNDASNLGSDVHLDNVTVEAEKNLLIGGTASEDKPVEVDGVKAEDSVANGFSANGLDLGAANGAIITGDQVVTLGGSNGNENIVTNNNGSYTTLVVGVNSEDDNSKGTLNIGTKDDKEYKHNGKVHVNHGSELNTKGQTTITQGVELENGNLNVHEKGHLEAEVKVTGNGKSVITGKVNGNLKVEGQHPSTMIHLGNENKAGKMKADKSELKGATLFLDPFYADGMPSGSEFALKDAANLDGAYVAGQNSTISFGVDNLETAHTVFAETELTFGSGTQNGNTVNGDVNAVIYIADSVSLNNAAGNLAGSITANGALTSAPTATPGKVIFADKSLLMVEAEKVANKAAISGVTATDVSDKAKLYINNAQKDGEYKILAGSSISTVWTDDNITTNNKLIVFEGSATGNAFDVKAVSQSVNDVYGDDVIIGEVVDESIANGGSSSDIFNSAANEDINVDRNAQVDALNSIGAMNEVAGVTHTTYAVSNILTDAVADHMSLANGKEHDKDIWAHYVHTKENVDGLKRAGSYDAQYNGIVVGTDLYNEGKATVGAALTYVDGNINGSTLAARTENDAKYYGASIYGSIENKDTAVIADVSYLHGEHDITQRNSGVTITGEPESDAFSVGVRIEQSTKAGIGKLVPYAGLRYMHLGTANYTNSIGLAYDADDAELFLLPVGLKYSSEVKNTNGWTVRPVVELGYVWVFGDTDTNQTVSLNGASNGFGYDVTDSGSYVGRFVLEAEKANISYALGYEYQKGDDVKADKWMVNVNWKF